jgi:hypothetical protein
MRALGRKALAASLALLAIAPLDARADKPMPPAEKRDSYSPYERETIEKALKKVHGAVEPSPEGKILEGIDVVSLDVFEDRDPLPSFLTPIANWFHVTSRDYVIEREINLRPGEPYQQAIVDESARNLRGLDQISLVLCVPLKGGAPDRVRLLVVTKDVWSLRLNSNFRFGDGRLQSLTLQPSEVNLLGTHQQILGNFIMDPATIALGGSYIFPRIAGSRIRATLGASAIVNRTTGKLEGSYGSLSYGQPLYSTRATWAWGLSMGWDYEIVRRFIGGLQTDFDPTQGKCVVPDAVLNGMPMGPDHQQCQYRRDVISGSYGVTRSWGSSFKHDLNIGVFASRKQYRTLDLSGLTPDQQQAYVTTYMPVSDTQIGPYFEYHTYSTRYVDLLDVDTLGLTESHQNGHDITVRVTPITKALRSSRNFVDVYASAAYQLPLGDGLVRASIASDTEITTEGLPDASFGATLRIITPRFGRGRLVFDARFLDRYQNYLNAKSTLGGDTRLRGYPAGAFIGNNLLMANLEYRSDPLEILACQLGFVIFADAGDAFDSFATMRIKQGAGFGLRAVFPQLQRSVMRVDIGFPLTQGALPPEQSKADVVVTFGQAF